MVANGRFYYDVNKRPQKKITGVIWAINIFFLIWVYYHLPTRTKMSHIKGSPKRDLVQATNIRGQNHSPGKQSLWFSVFE